MSEKKVQDIAGGAKRPQPKKRVASRKAASTPSSRAGKNEPEQEFAAQDAPETTEGDVVDKAVIAEAASRASKAKPSKRTATKVTQKKAADDSSSKAKDGAARAAAKARAAALSAAYEKSDDEADQEKPAPKPEAVRRAKAVAESLESADSSAQTSDDESVDEEVVAAYSRERYGRSQVKEQRPAPEKRPRPKRKIRIGRLITRTLLILVFAIIVGAIGSFCWQYWFRYDDAANMEGTWLVQGSETTVSIESGSIKLNDEVSYDLAVDGRGKILSCEFGPYSGESHYRFSLDRSLLFIEDASSASPLVLFDDAGMLVAELSAQLQETTIAYPDDENVVVLVRQ